MKKLFTALLIFSFIFYQIPVLAVDETAPDSSQASPEVPPEDEGKEDAPPSEEGGEKPGEEIEPSEGEEPPPEEQDPENPEPGEDAGDLEADPPSEENPEEETPSDAATDLTALTELLELQFSQVQDEVSAIRKNTDIIIYFVIPVLCAILLICKLGVWFYSTFIKDAL